jgi:hypothetical protein
MFPLMFDRIMENSMALWLPVSAAYLIFMARMIVMAFRHFRRARHPGVSGRAARAQALSGASDGRFRGGNRGISR